ncbi:MAG: polysaccharide deacetylase family protein [Oscillospiraceae bacterium]|nr:polysaccharide deacetylase family protein [Oscillospiraceae bacterium]
MRKVTACILLLWLAVIPAQASSGRKYIALTFDDGPSGRYTQTLLDGLKLRGVKATFLLCGYRMEQYPQLTQRIFDEGHEIGYHGFSHDSMQRMSRRQIGQELIDSRVLLPEGCDPVWFRPPGGVVTDGVRQVAQARQLALLSWSVDPMDWKIKSTATIEQTVLKKVGDGDIILLHDMSMTSVQAALDIVDALQEQGFRFVTASELAKLREIAIKPGAVYKSFPAEDEIK